MKESAGFTLIELVMTLAIIGVLSAVSYQHFNPAIFELRAAADDLIGAIRHTQGRAMNHSGIAAFTINISQHGYRILRDGGAIMDPISGQSGFGQDWPDITLAPTTLLAFDGKGAPGLSAPLAITLSKGTESARIIIENETGFAR